MIIIEGLDGVGKTTLVNYFVTQGMKKHHFDYDANNMDLFSKYMRVLKEENLNLVLDRSFISEMVYGPILRGKSKLELEQYKKLLEAYKQVGTSIIYLTSPQDILLERRRGEPKDFEMILNYYKELNNQYNAIMDYNEEFIDVMRFDTNIMNEHAVQEKAKRLVLK